MCLAQIHVGKHRGFLKGKMTWQTKRERDGKMLEILELWVICLFFAMFVVDLQDEDMIM